MAEEQIIASIKDQRSCGIADAAIKSALLKAGWQQAQVDDAFALLDLTTSTEIPLDQLKKEKPAAASTPPQSGLPSTPQQGPLQKTLPVIGVLTPKKILFLIGCLLVVIFIIIGIVASAQRPQQSTGHDNAAVTKKQQQPHRRPSPKTTVTTPASSSETTDPSNGRDATRRNDLVQIQTALNNYHDKHNDYPKSLNQLIPDFLNVVPGDPKTFIPYDYTYDPTLKNYALCATFEASGRKCASSKLDAKTLK